MGHNYSMAEELMTQTRSPQVILFLKRTLSSYQVLNSIESERIIRVYSENYFVTIYKDVARPTIMRILYIDDDHLSVAGSQMLAEMVKRSILSSDDDVGKSFTKKQTH